MDGKLNMNIMSNTGKKKHVHRVAKNKKVIFYRWP